MPAAGVARSAAAPAAEMKPGASAHDRTDDAAELGVSRLRRDEAADGQQGGAATRGFPAVEGLAHVLFPINHVDFQSSPTDADHRRRRERLPPSSALRCGSASPCAVLIFWSIRSANATLLFLDCWNTSISVLRRSLLSLQPVSRSMLRICGSVGDSERPQSQTQTHFLIVQLISSGPTARCR